MGKKRRRRKLRLAQHTQRFYSFYCSELGFAPLKVVAVSAEHAVAWMSTPFDERYCVGAGHPRTAAELLDRIDRTMVVRLYALSCVDISARNSLCFDFILKGTRRGDGEVEPAQCLVECLVECLVGLEYLRCVCNFSCDRMYLPPATTQPRLMSEH